MIYSPIHLPNFASLKPTTSYSLPATAASPPSNIQHPKSKIRNPPPVNSNPPQHPLRIRKFTFCIFIKQKKSFL